MKNPILTTLFILITLACVAMGGIDVMSVAAKAFFYMITTGILMVIGIVLVVNHLETEEEEAATN
ncbi:MAG TPA: hypothetical protein VK120_04520 [Sporosarcina sp.]|nr:hypothetical protein [Sporosarcina sp.]